MATGSLTKKMIGDLLSGKEIEDWPVDTFRWDSRVPAFGIRRGRKFSSYVIQFAVAGQRGQRRVAFGRVGELALDEARELAAERLRIIRATGRDPGAREVLPTPAEASVTVAELIWQWRDAAGKDDYRGGKEDGPLRASTLDWLRGNRTRIDHVWGSVKVADLTTEKMIEVVEGIIYGRDGRKPSPSMAAQIKSHTKSALTWAEGFRKDLTVPTIEWTKVPTPKRQRRNNRLEDAHYKEVMDWLDAFHRGEKRPKTPVMVQAAFALEALMRSGRRKFQICGARRDMFFPTLERPDYLLTDDKIASKAKLYFTGPEDPLLLLLRRAIDYSTEIGGRHCGKQWIFPLLRRNDDADDKRHAYSAVNDLFDEILTDLKIVFEDADDQQGGRRQRITDKPTIHDLRRGFAHQCYVAGLSAAEAATVGGWSDPKTMLSFYLHFDSHDVKAMTARLQAQQAKILGSSPTLADNLSPALAAKLAERAGREGVALDDLVAKLLAN